MTGIDFNAWGSAPPWLVLTAMGLLGLIVGSFLNVVILRWPKMMDRAWWTDTSDQLANLHSFSATFGSAAPPALTQVQEDLERRLGDLPRYDLWQPGSHCTSCGRALRWWHNVPLLSWALLRGRCAYCGATISWQYPLVELGCATVFAALTWRLGPTATSLMWCAWAATLLAAAVIDARTTLLPDALTLPLLWAGLLCAAFGWTLAPSTAIAGATVGYLFLWSVHQTFLMLTGREGMGRGDFKLLAALGAWLGWQPLLPLILWAALAGSLVGLAMKWRGVLKDPMYVPFGPFLAASALAVVLVGPERSVSLVLGWGAWLHAVAWG